MTKSFTIGMASMDIYLVTGQEEILRIKALKGYIAPEMDGATAKCTHVSDTLTGYNCIIIIYPNLLKDEPLNVTSTLVHEACHAWDFNRDYFGFGQDSELHAYSVESIFNQLYERYSTRHHKLIKAEVTTC